MAKLVIRVVRDVFRHVTIKNFKRCDIRCIPPPKCGGDSPRGMSTCSPNAYSSEFPGLFPQVTFEDFGGGEKPRMAASPSVKLPRLLCADTLPTLLTSAAAGPNAIAPTPTLRKKIGGDKAVVKGQDY